jgi:peptide/nickel transport system substrate-binding protein
MLGAVYSKLLTYRDFYQSITEPDLAQTMPEQPDDLTYVIKIWPNATFHDTPQIRNNLAGIAPDVPGRQLTADDVKYSIERQTNERSPKSALYPRKRHWQSVDKIEVMDPLTLRITTKRPTAPFIAYLADAGALIIAKELVDPETDETNAVERTVGTGPFILEEFTALQVSRTVRNPNWFGKDLKADEGLVDRPILDGYEASWITADMTFREAAFRSKQIESLQTEDPKTVERVASELALPWDQALGSGPVNSGFLVDDSPNAKTPFKDVRLRKAIHLAVDRNRMVQQMLLGGGYACGPVSQALRKWAFTPAELATKPGYRFGASEREEDLQEARRLWEAAGGDAIGSVPIVYAGIPDYITDFFPQFQATLKEVLGFQLEGQLDTTGYLMLAQGAFQQSVVMTFGFDNGWNDLDDYLYRFHSNAQGNWFNLSDPELDRMLDAQRGEMDFERRRQLGSQTQDYLLDKVVAQPMWVGGILTQTDWSYHRNWRRAPWFDDGYWRANQWFDKSDPTWQGRPA